MTPENWPEPVAHLIERHAFRCSPHGQDAEGHDWLEVDEEVSPQAFQVYTATQVREIVRMEVEAAVAEVEKQIMYAMTWARSDDLRAAIEGVDFCGQMISVRLSLLGHLMASLSSEAQEKLKSTYGDAPIRPEIQPWFDSAAILKAAVSSRKENKDAD